MKVMKPIFFLGAALALASCSSNEEGMETPNGNIAPVISAELAGADTRAHDASWDVNDQIGISCTSADGTDYTNMQYVTAQGDGNFAHVGGDASGIIYQGTQEATFSAYYPFAGTEGTNPVCNLSTDDQTASRQKTFDYLYANGAKGSKANPKVSFSGTCKFSHRMTRVILNIVNNSDTDLTLDDLKKGNADQPVKYRLSGVKLNGSFNPATGVAEASGAVSSLWEFSATATESVVQLEGKDHLQYSLILYPQTLEDGAKVTFNALKNGAEYKCDLTPSPLFAAGKSYVYTIKVSKKGMTVENCEISDWTTEINENEIEAA